MYSGTCLIRHTKGPGKCVGLYRILEYSGFILVNRNILGQQIFVACHRTSDNSGVGLHMFHCNLYMKNQHVQGKGIIKWFPFCHLKGEMFLSPLP